MRVSETRSGDTKARAGLIITDGQYLLVCKPTPSSRWPNPKLDLPKGHIQAGEDPMDAAIRECWEETNIRFEKWKLSLPKRFTMDGEPLFLWMARLSELPPVALLSCASTFIDDATGIRHPEMAGYEYLSLFDARFNGAFAKLQDGLRPCAEAYFNADDCPNYPFEDGRICADKINLPDGLYRGLHTAYFVTLANGTKFKTTIGVKGRNVPCAVEIQGGFVYGKRLGEDCQTAGPMMGDLPQNIDATLSLGYKSGRTLPQPGKKTNPRDYDSIPRF
jgi:8-oxo-dGTP pyrophosphatase MutT (NUDIX family)